MVNFVGFKRTDGKLVYVNGEIVTHVVEGIPGIEGETAVIHFSDTHSLRVNGRALKVSLKLGETAASAPAEAEAPAPAGKAAGK